MSPSKHERTLAAARSLIDAQRSGRWIDRLPSGCAPESVAEAYAIQDAVIRLRGEPVVGWKTSNGSPPTCSPVFAVARSGAVLEAAAFHAPKVEIEFGFVALEDLPPRNRRATPDDILARLAFTPIIEVVSSRYADRTRCTRFEVLADGSNGALIAGDPVPWTGVDFATRAVALSINGALVQSGSGTHPLANPADLVVWLAGHLAERAEGLKRGAVVTTGGLHGVSPVRAGDVATGDWGGLGRIEVRFE